ncbi:MAG TPA: hypothetical protein VMT37_03655 [Solirubrobacterales bacterium]|nr:hypothetical protein [Solirubrobacterales bacterium]
MTKSKLGIYATLLLALAIGGSVARAAEATPADEYRAQAEPICKTNVLANRKIFKGAKGEVKAGKLKQASAHFKRAATAFGKTIRQLAAIPQPPEYEVKLGKWLDLLGETKATIGKIGTALAAENKRKAEAFSVELHRLSTKANNTVLDFEFNYCRIEESRFG